MEAKAVDADAIFRAFTACGKDPKTLLLDVRPHKDFKKGHINQAYNPRLATNGKFLADYSQSSYSMPWSQVRRGGAGYLFRGEPQVACAGPAA
jgi:dual specificity MAP kinase phosphatase